MGKDVYLGLDIGAGSVGWALTDDEYNFIRIKGKNAYGSRIFDEAKDCKERRMIRSNRRRLERRKYRIKLLNEIFNDVIVEKDPTFFMRLNESNLVLEDKKYSKWTLFENRKKEQEYNRNYPTIWHLRKELVTNPNSNAYDDIRLPYMAIHHILKYRGNFLKEGQTFNFTNIDSDVFKTLNSIIIENSELFDCENDVFDIDEKDEIMSILLDDKLNLTSKKTEIKKHLKTTDKELIKMLQSLLVGSKYNFAKLLNCDEKIEICFKTDPDELLEANITRLNNLADLVKTCKQIYDFCILYKLLNGEQFICIPMVKIYEKHKKSLAKLKKILVDIDKKMNLYKSDKGYYYKVLIDNKNTDKVFNYPAFIDAKSCQYLEFEKFMSNINTELKSKNINDLDCMFEQEKFKEEYSFDTIALNSTSVIPYQLHQMELCLILKNLQSHYPTFTDDVCDRILSIFTFKIPYYVGPLSSDEKACPYSNLVKQEGKEQQKIRPWNYKDIIDFDKTRQKFMGMRLNKCLYLYGEDVLPNQSLLYEEYVFLDKINALKVNGNLITLKQQKEIFQMACGKSYLTKKDISNLLLKGDKNTQITLSGVDFTSGKLKFGLLSHNFFSKLGFDLENDYEMIEYIIKVLSIYKDDKRPAFDVIKNAYPQLNEKTIKAILSYKCDGFGSFSKALLDGKIYFTDDNGVVHTIIQLMRENVLTFEQVRYKYNLNKQIDKFNSGKTNVEEILDEEMDNIPPQIRRSVNQTIGIVDELNDLLKQKKQRISKVFIEVTREHQEKKPTLSRYDNIKNFLKDIKKQQILDNKEIEQLSNDLEIKKNQLNAQAIYLYFKQLGYDLYTGEKITSLDDVINGTYDIDHIIPQSILKDDSLDNKVLVNRLSNQNIKKNIYPLPLEIRMNPKVRKLWYILHKNTDLMNDEKYNRLVREEPLNEDELNDFVNRQISNLNYTNREVVKILKLKYPYLQNNIVYSKSTFVSRFRVDNKIYKLRYLNNCHHAVDAYLNIVVGDVIDKTFTNETSRKNIISNLCHNESNKNLPMTLNFMRVFEKSWVPYFNDEIKKKVINNCFRKDMLLTNKSYIEKGSFYKQTIFKKGGKDALIPIHTKGYLNDTNKYGGYANLFNSQFALIEYGQQEKRKQAIIGVPVIDLIVSENTNTPLADLIHQRRGFEDVKIIKLIKNKSKVESCGSRMEIVSSSTSNNLLGVCFDEPLFLDQELTETMYLLDRFSEELPEKDDIQSVTFVTNKQGGTIEITKKMTLKVFKYLTSQQNEPRFGYLKNAGDLDSILKNQSSFENISMSKQRLVLLDIIKLFAGPERSADFKIISTDDNKIHSSIRYFVNNNPRKYPLKIIYESITGLRVKKVLL